MARNSAGSTRGHATTVVTGRRQGTTRLTATFVALLVGVGTIALAVPPTPANATGPTLGTQTLAFAYTGAPTSFTVPPGVTSATFSVSGAQGGTPEHDIGSPVSGLGGEAVDSMTVTPGTVYSIYVGGQNGWNGGGGGGASGDGYVAANGGGASDVRVGGSALSDRVLVGGGGGGAGDGNYEAGGSGGGATGGAGTSVVNGDTWNGGSGGTQSAGGAGGTCTDCVDPGTTGSLGQGGGGGAGDYLAGGGGGGGYYGGGGASGCDVAGTCVGPGGGGGSGYGPAGTAFTSGAQSGNGSVVVTYTGALLPVVTLAASSQGTTIPGYAETYTATVAKPTGTTVAIGNGTFTFTDGSNDITGCVDVAVSSGKATCTTTYGLAGVGSHTITATYSGDTNYYATSASTTVQVYQQRALFSFTGSSQTWTVPAGVTSATVEVLGAQGGDVSCIIGTAAGGDGGQAVGSLTVSPSEALQVNVGGTDGWNGGGAASSGACGGNGGGATDVRTGSDGLANRIAVAGGGGGGADTAGGSGGGTTGGTAGAGYYGGGGGGGATQSAGGSGGAAGGGGAGGGGSLGQGGQGGTTTDGSNGAGGGGGGYYGGGGGGGATGANGGGGGGGSGYGSGFTLSSGVNSGNGSASIFYSGLNPTTTGVTSSSSSVTTGSSVTLTAAVSVAAGSLPLSLATGTVTFADGGTPISGCTALAPNASGDAVCTTTLVATGTNVLTATYSGDTDFATSAGTTDVTVTDRVTVTDPGNQTSTSGTAINPLVPSASSVGGTVTSWSATGLPPGLSINATTGTVSGTPLIGTPVGSPDVVTLTATDDNDATGSATFDWTVTNTVTVTDPGAQTATAGTPITPLTLTATSSGAIASISGWSLDGSAPGLTISAAGVVTGTPTTGGTYAVTATATDSDGYSGTSTVFTWTVTDTVTVTNPGAQASTSGTAISPLVPSASSDGGTIVGWTATGLPAGLGIDPTTGTISGTPTTGTPVGSPDVVTLTARDNTGATGSATVDWTVANTVTVTSPGAQTAAAGTPITPVTLSATTSDPSATIAGWYLDGSAPGLSVSAAGVVTGTPTTGGTYAVTATATDSDGYSGTSTVFTWTVTDTVTVTNPGAQASTSGTAISPLVPSASSDGGTIVGWTATGLPAGLGIDPTTGTISGTPTTGTPVGSPDVVTLTARDNTGATGSATVDWTVANTVTVPSPGDQAGDASVAIVPLAVTATDSDPSATLAYQAAGLPTGLSIDPTTGTITGTPTTAGTTSVVLTATDGAGYVGTAGFTWTINPPPTVSTTSLSDATTNVAYSDTLAVSGGTAPFTWSITSGSLPVGLTLDASTGTIAGTPTTAGTAELHVAVTDSSRFGASAALTLTVVAAGPYTAVAPVRVCDTRAGNPSGLSGPAAQCNGTGGTGTRLVPGVPHAVTVAGEFGVPADATAVVVNVTAVDPSSNGYVTVYPAGDTTPGASNLNVRADSRVANLVETGVGTDGAIDVIASTAVDVVVDLQGYVTTAPSGGAGLYNPLTSPARICDTRAGNPSGLTGGAAQCNGTANGGRRLAAGVPLDVTVAGNGGVPATGVSAVVLNVTAVGPSAAGYLSVYPAGTSAPTASNLNYLAGQTVAERVIVPVSATGAVSVVVNQASDVLVDVSGWYSATGGSGSQYSAAAAPVRICDTRPGNPSGLTGGAAQCNGTAGTGAALGPGGTRTVTVTGLAGVPADATAVVVNVTAIDPTSATHLTVFPSGTVPVVSDLNPPAGGVVANLVVARLSADGTFTIANYAGTVNVAVDVAGWYV